jgi:hypothetical protein
MEEVVLAEIPDLGRQPDESLLAINEALDRLARTDPLKVRLIEMRYFGTIPAMWSVALDGARIHSHLYPSAMQPIPACLR